MADPYRILNIQSSSSDDEVKAAYKDLASKYDSSSYPEGDPFADLASKKMEEINGAYDQIMNDRRSKSSEATGNSTASDNFSNTSGAVEFSDIRRYINNGQVGTAEELLNGTPASNRTAEWYFLKGSIFYSKGWIEEATNYFGQAVNKDPSNQEYSAAYNQLIYRRKTGVSGMNGIPNGGAQCTACDMCSTLMCMNCLCNGCCR